MDGTVFLAQLLLYEQLHAMILACCMIEIERKKGNASNPVLKCKRSVSKHHPSCLVS